ncbi:hypothetical protein B0T10DRAFT_518486 [Thelonectria olida]|uniref:Uncharacterized protein n=1 Tax=Thelonectria olida TaxID=1576542 RepID=A0A9P9AIG5_9HYPO|nr:hypothetical protein B0T10DRAFT_518486 [Thelonectria olida]
MSSWLGRAPSPCLTCLSPADDILWYHIVILFIFTIFYSDNRDASACNMFQDQFPFSGLDDEVDGHTAVAAEGAVWNPYHVDVPYLLYRQWTGLDWSQLPTTDYQQDFQSHSLETLSQHSPVLNDSGFASRIKPTIDQSKQLEQFNQASCSPSYTTDLQSLDRKSSSTLPSDVSPSSISEPDYDEHDDHKAIEAPRTGNQPDKPGPRTKPLLQRVLDKSQQSKTI